MKPKDVYDDDEIPDDVIDSGLPYGRDDVIDELETMSAYQESMHESSKDLNI